MTSKFLVTLKTANIFLGQSTLLSTQLVGLMVLVRSSISAVRRSKFQVLRARSPAPLESSPVSVSLYVVQEVVNMWLTSRSQTTPAIRESTSTLIGHLLSTTRCLVPKFTLMEVLSPRSPRIRRSQWLRSHFLHRSLVPSLLQHLLRKAS